MIADADGIIQYVNSAFTLMTGYICEEFRGIVLGLSSQLDRLMGDWQLAEITLQAFVGDVPFQLNKLPWRPENAERMASVRKHTPLKERQPLLRRKVCTRSVGRWNMPGATGS